MVNVITEQQQKLRYAEVRNRLLNLPKPKKVELVNYTAPPGPIEVVNERPAPKPQWMWVQTYFDQHVIASRSILSKIKAGEIDVDAIKHRTMHEIATEVLRTYPGITLEMVKGLRRSRDIVEARQHCTYAIYSEREDLSFPAMGRFLRRDHTTIIYTVRVMAKKLGGSLRC